MSLFVFLICFCNYFKYLFGKNKVSVSVPSMITIRRLLTKNTLSLIKENFVLICGFVQNFQTEFGSIFYTIR